MRRLGCNPRVDWKAAVESVGLTFHTHLQGETPQPYWCESAYYEFTAAEVDRLEKAIRDLHYLLIDVAEQVVARGLWERLAIPEHAVPMIERSWQADDFSLYGRFDLAFIPGGEPKLLEYNADTPTSLVEASVAQWHWLQAKQPGMDQFNSIHERLIDAWKRYGSLYPSLRLIDFTSVSENLEDEQTISYLVDTAQQAGFRTRWTEIGEIGYDNDRQCFVPGGGPDAEPIVACFKLYPWEWLFREEFGQFITEAPTFWIEPPWKALLSNKAILALAWEQHQGHPNLLPCFFEPEPLGGSFVKKPKLSREGANITIQRKGDLPTSTGGDYGQDGYVYQALADLPVFDGIRPVVGGWVVDHEPAGMGIREADGLITDNFSRFVPHCFAC